MLNFWNGLLYLSIWISIFASGRNTLYVCGKWIHWQTGQNSLIWIHCLQMHTCKAQHDMGKVFESFNYLKSHVTTMGPWNSFCQNISSYYVKSCFLKIQACKGKIPTLTPPLVQSIGGLFSEEHHVQELEEEIVKACKTRSSIEKSLYWS